MERADETSPHTNYRHLCSPSNPVTAELFRDDLLEAVEDISDTNCLSSKLTKDGRSNSVSKSSQKVAITNNKQSRNVQSPRSTSDGSRRGRRRAID